MNKVIIIFLFLISTMSVNAQNRFADNGNGTITDTSTGLMWQQDPGEKVTWEEALANADTLTLGGYDDWRVPTITELYSLMDFNGVTGMNVSGSVPYIDTDYFVFEYGNEAAGERMIDAQYWSSTEYVSTTMDNQRTVFGVNFADGRIKGYSIISLRGNAPMQNFVRYVRGSSTYGTSQFVNNGNGTIADSITGLTWMQNDSGVGMDWVEAVNWCEQSTLAGFDDWRLPDAQELQYLVDYSRSPDTTNSAAINPIFNTTSIIDEGGNVNYAFYWTSTSHMDGPDPDLYAVYIAFGEALGYMNGQLMDVHGAGAQRSDPKTGSASAYPEGHGPQGDVVRIDNYVRCVRGGVADPIIVTTSNGQSQAQPQGSSQPPINQTSTQPQPPQEAINACAGQQQGSTCSFNTPQGTINGTCAPVQNQQMACLPPHPPGQ